MPHQMIEELQSRRDEKVALFLTMHNAAGLILGAVPAFLLTFRTLPWYLTFLITIAAGALGVVATLSVGGMALYERGVWWVRGFLKQRLSSARLRPEEIAGGGAAPQHDAALALGGAVRLVRRHTYTPVQRPRATPLGRRAVPLTLEPVGAGTNGYGPQLTEEGGDADPTAE